MKQRWEAPTLRGSTCAGAPRGREVLEQLDHVLAAGHPEMGHPDVRVGVADDRREISALLLLGRDHLAAEQVAVEDERAVQVGDRVAGVMEAASSHRHPGDRVSQLDASLGRDDEDVLDPRAVAAGEVHARLDGEHHPRLERHVIARFGSTGTAFRRWWPNSRSRAATWLRSSGYPDAHVKMAHLEPPCGALRR